MANFTFANDKYYYNSVVSPGNAVDFCSAIQFSNSIGNQYQNCQIKLVFNIDAIQSQNEAYIELWPDAPNEWKNIIKS